MTDKDYTTWHDQKPSHNIKPDYLVHVEEFIEQLNADRDRYADTGEYQMVEVVDEFLANAEITHSTAWALWQNELAAMLEPTECACVLPDQSCQACMPAQTNPDDGFPF